MALLIFLIFTAAGPLLSQDDSCPPLESRSRIAQKCIERIRINDIEIARLRREISENLKSTARNGRLAFPLRFLRYRVRPEDEFFRLMADVSQNPDTLASLNDLMHPSDLEPGSFILIPNARGIFSSGDASAVAARFSVKPEEISRYGSTVFIPGIRYRAEESNYFHGVGFETPLRSGRISSGYGLRFDPFLRRATFHGGLDIAAATGTEVRASREGSIVRAGPAGSYGNLIVIEHGFGYRTYYGHLSRVLVRAGQPVNTGAVIGLVGSTGLSTGPHLHFEMRRSGRPARPEFIHQ